MALNARHFFSHTLHGSGTQIGAHIPRIPPGKNPGYALTVPQLYGIQKLSLPFKRVLTETFIFFVIQSQLQ